jgi:hypothetical protein
VEDPLPIPEPPPPPVAAPIVTPAPPQGARDESATVYDVKSELTGRGRFLKLHLMFRLRRQITMGAQALRKNHVVANAPLKHFSGTSGQLVLNLDTEHYPTGLRFITDAPTVTLENPGDPLHASIELDATATPYRGRHIVSMAYEYSPSGEGLWYPIGSVNASPWKLQFNTLPIAPGLFDFRAIATDNKGVSGVSPVISQRTVAVT